jgi:AcrR family transcriptional regulator
MNSDKELQVIQAAYKVFFRYGFARTTMGDLAKEAGLSRPALYLIYPGKAEVFQAVVEWMTESMLDTIASTLKADWPLERKLTHTLEVSIAKGYDEVKAHPDAQDLLSLDSQMPGLEHAYLKLQMCLADLLEDSVKASGLKATANEIARTLMSAMRGFKLVATDGKDLRRLIALQVALVSSALGQSARETHGHQKRSSAESKARRTTAST